MPRKAGEQAKRDIHCRHGRLRNAGALRRHALPIALWLVCSGFSWPGRLPHLVYVVAHGQPAERIEALRLLEQYPSEQTSEALLSALEDGDPDVRLQAASSAARLRVVDAAPVLSSWLGSPRVEQRSSALRALGQLADARALPGVERSLGDPAPEVRVAAIGAIGGYLARGQASADALLPSLGDEEPALRLAAIAALARALEAPRTSPLGPSAGAPPRAAEASPPLSAAAQAKLSERARDQDAEVRASALRVLARVQGARSLPVLAQALADADVDVRLSALAALGDSGAQGAVPLLRARSTGATREGRTAVAALGRSDAPAAASALSAGLTRVELAEAAASALLVRARRLDEPAAWSETFAAISGALRQAPGSALLATVPELARHTDASPLGPALLQSLRQGSGDPVLVTRALCALSKPADVAHPPHAATPTNRGADSLQHATPASAATTELGCASPEVLSVLGERSLDAGPARESWLSALELALSHARDAQRPEGLGPLLLQLLEQSPSAGRARLFRLLALTRTPGPAAARPQDDAATRGELAGWFGALPDAPERRGQLLLLLRDADAAVQRRAADALAANAGEASVSALVSELERSATPAALQALAGALLRLDGGAHLPAELRERIFQRLSAQLSAADTRSATAALYALRTLRDPRAAPLVAGLLRTGSASRRASAVLALGDHDTVDARRLLRHVLQNESPRSALAASLALAEVASERDAPALLRAAQRGIWPLPAAASYALARIAQRGVLKQHTFERLLCQLAALRDPYVRANAAAGLAALGAEACDAQLSPEAWLEPHAPAALRVAAAHWLRRSPPAPQRQRALAACASDADPHVAAACSEHTAPEAAPGKLLVRALSAGGATWTDRPLALRLPGGAVYVGPTDANGQLLLSRVPHGEIIMEDPADVPGDG